MDNTVKFTVQFDPEAWKSMDDDQRNAWIDRVNDLINEEAYVSKIETQPVLLDPLPYKRIDTYVSSDPNWNRHAYQVTDGVNLLYKWAPRAKYSQNPEDYE